MRGRQFFSRLLRRIVLLCCLSSRPCAPRAPPLLAAASAPTTVPSSPPARPPRGALLLCSLRFCCCRRCRCMRSPRATAPAHTDRISASRVTPRLEFAAAASFVRIQRSGERRRWPHAQHGTRHSGHDKTSRRGRHAAETTARADNHAALASMRLGSFRLAAGAQSNHADADQAACSEPGRDRRRLGLSCRGRSRCIHSIAGRLFNTK